MKTTQHLDLRHVVCPIDLSGQFVSSLQYATAIAYAHHAELRAIHVVPAEGAERPHGLESLARDVLMRELRDALARGEPAHDLVGGAVRIGDPATEILQYARAMHADVIVLGAPGADRAERPLGPVASVVIMRSDCPVLAVPAHAAAAADALVSGVFSRIVCGIDSTPSSASVIRQAASLAWETAGRLTYVCAVEEGDASALSRLRNQLRAAVPPHTSDWCDVDVVVTRGNPSHEIVRIAAEAEADLVVTGAPRRWTSTTQAVLRRSLCPVLVAHDAHPLPWPPSPRGPASAVLAGMNRSRE